MEIWAPGTEVKVGNQTAMVLTVQISENGVRYKVSWWSEADRKEAWVENVEVDGPNKKTPIGFRQ